MSPRHGDGDEVTALREELAALRLKLAAAEAAAVPTPENDVQDFAAAQGSLLTGGPNPPRSVDPLTPWPGSSGYRSASRPATGFQTPLNIVPELRETQSVWRQGAHECLETESRFILLPQNTWKQSLDILIHVFVARVTLTRTCSRTWGRREERQTV